MRKKQRTKAANNETKRCWCEYLDINGNWIEMMEINTVAIGWMHWLNARLARQFVRNREKPSFSVCVCLLLSTVYSNWTVIIAGKILKTSWNQLPHFNLETCCIEAFNLCERNEKKKHQLRRAREREKCANLNLNMNAYYVVRANCEQ